MSELLKVEDVVKICSISKGTAYKIMREVNEELEKKGYIIIRGRVNKEYLYKKLGLKGEIQ